MNERERTDVVVPDTTEFDLLVPNWVADTLPAHGTVLRARHLNRVRQVEKEGSNHCSLLAAHLLNIKNLHGALVNELLGHVIHKERDLLLLGPPLNRQELNFGKEAVRCSCNRRELGVILSNPLVAKASCNDGLQQGEGEREKEADLTGPQLAKKNVFVNHLDAIWELGLLVSLGLPLQVARVNTTVIVLDLLWVSLFRPGTTGALLIELKDEGVLLSVFTPR